MKLSAILIISLTFLFMSMFHRPSRGQQEYVGGDILNCSSASLGMNGFLCDNPQLRCLSYMTFRSIPPYDTPSSIANLLASKPSSLASLNNFSFISETIPSHYLVIVPVSCTCSGSIFQHNAPYTVIRGDYYFRIVNNTYQGLTTCRAIMSQNYYDAEEIPVGVTLLVPLRCACPSTKQVENGVNILLTYMATEGDTLEKIGGRFGVSNEAIMEANMLTNKSKIYPFNPILVPLKLEDCIDRPGSFYCSCPNGYLRVGSLWHFQCVPIRGKRFPIKLVLSIGK